MDGSRVILRQGAAVASSPHLEWREAKGGPFRVGAGVDRPVDRADRVQADLYGVLDGERRVTDREPVLSITAAQGIHDPWFPRSR